MPGARTKRIARIAEAIPFAEELSELRNEMNGINWTRHDSHESDIWLPLPISMNNREDDPRDVSNFHVAQKRLDEVSPFGTDYRMDAWPGGVIHTLMVRADDAAALREAESLVAALQDHPILDEDDFSEREWDHNHPTDGECYADDCSCDVAEKRAEVEYHESIGQAGHVEGLGQSIIMPDYDHDGDWWCETCETWFTFIDDERAQIAAQVEVCRYRFDMREWEEAGQLALL